jgi:hypothetical protein
MVVKNVKMENIVIQVVIIYVLHVPMDKDPTQVKMVVKYVKTENIVSQIVGMYVQPVLLDMN